MNGSSDLPESFYCTQPVDFSKTLDTSVLNGKSVIVTGGSSGIGLACVESLAEAGAYVTVLDINEQRGDEVAQSLTKKGLHVQFTKTDTTSWASSLRGFQSAISFSPQQTIDLVVCSAGLAGNNVGSNWLDKAITTDTPEAPTTRTIDVNLTGLYYSAHLALYFFKKHPGNDSSKFSKQIIFISSLAGYLPLFQLCDYNASKFGVRGMWKDLRHSTNILSPDGPVFRTNLIAPTFIHTPMVAGGEAGLTSMGIELGEVEDVAAGVMRAACDEDIHGRAIAIAARSEGGVVGDRNFDLGDDWNGLDAGNAVVDSLRGGPIKGLELVGFSVDHYAAHKMRDANGKMIVEGQDNPAVTGGMRG